MKSFEQFLEDAPVRTYNDPSLIASPESRRRAGRREIERDYGDKLDTQAAAAAVRKPDVETEKEKKFGIGTGPTMFDKSGVAGTKEDDRKPLELRPKRRNSGLDELKDRFGKSLSSKESFIPGVVRDALDKFTADRDEDDNIKKDRWKNANKVVDSISGKNPFMDVLSAAHSTVQNPTGYQKRLMKLKELVDNEDIGELDEDKISPALKMRVELKAKVDSLTDKMDEQGLDPFEFLPDVSESEELMSDFDVEESESTDFGEFIPRHWRKIAKVVEGLPNHRVLDFLESIDAAHKMYKGEMIDDFDKLRSVFAFDDEAEPGEELIYQGANTSWSLYPEEMSENSISPRHDGIDGEKDMREVAWNDIIDPRQEENLRNEDTESILTRMLTTGSQHQQQRAMAMLNEYLEKSGLSIEDALRGEGLEGFGKHIRRTTAFDALRTWREQIVPDLDDGQVLRNQPMYGGRDGNARERLYKKAGFGELLSDDYQYGQKVEGQDKLKPLGGDDLDITNYDEIKGYDFSTMSDDNFFSGFSWENVERHAEQWDMDEADLRIAAQDPDDYALDQYEQAKEEYLIYTQYYEHEDLKDAVSESPSVREKFETDEEIEEFDEFLTMVWDDMDLDEKEKLLRASSPGGYKRYVDEWVSNYYNEFMDNKED